MEIIAIDSAKDVIQQAYILTDNAQLQTLGLSKGEMSFVEEQLNEGSGAVALQKLPHTLHFIKIEATKHQFQALEKARIQGGKLAKNIQHKAEEIYVEDLTNTGLQLAFAEGMALGNYQFLKYFSDREKRAAKLQRIKLAAADKNEIRQLNAVLKAVYLSRDLVNEPLSYLTAEKLSAEIEKAGKEFGFKTEVLNKKKLEVLKMGGILAVNRGSQDPPTFTIAEYKPDKPINKKPIVLVGKGVVYDTGGLSLKPTAGSMDMMKSDMGGAAAVVGAISAIAGAELPVHVISLIPATDNRPGENAYAPGDVITMYNGSTVEVMNTDAEGRMLLADALHYAKQYDPQLVFDLATLTGSAAIAIGKQGVVTMGTADDEDFIKLEDAGYRCYERIARFPFWEEYGEQLKSSIADVKNIGGREAGAITAGKFLERFTDYPWIHMDIAGLAFLSKDNHYRLQGGTGVGVRLLFNYLKEMA